MMRLHHLLVLIVTLSGTTHAGENLLSDGNLGAGPVPPWAPVPVSGLSYSVIANDGQPAPSVEITTGGPSGSSSSGQGLYQCVPTTPGAVYRLTAFIKRTSVSTTTVATVGIAAAFYSGAGCTQFPVGLGNATVGPNTLVTGVWTAVNSGPVTAPVAPFPAVSALVGLGANGANNAVYTFRADTAFFGLNDVIFYSGFEND